MIVTLLLRRALEAGRLVPVETARGFALAINYFGIQFVLAEVTKEELEALSAPKLETVS